MTEQPAYDALLADRVKQLREIEERLTRLCQPRAPHANLYTDIRFIRDDVKLMIQNAEREHAEF